MKLVELLARELSEWPVVDGVEPNYIVQEGDKELYSTTIRPIYHGSETWHRSPNDNTEDCGYFDVTTEYLAEDWTAAIVTPTDWAAERARIAKPAKKADKDGWIRHRGGKCPVDEGVRVDYRMRNGSIDDFGRKSETLDWAHYSEIGDIMAYKIHKPAEQVEACSKPDPRDSAKRDSDYVCWMRDRITEIDATTSALATERAELVQKLAGEGFALIGRINDLLTEAAQKHEDMSDWRNWKVGDRLVLTASGLDDCEKGEMLTIDGLDFDDDNQPIGAQNDNGNHHWPILKEGHFKTLTWHSRPSA